MNEIELKDFVCNVISQIEQSVDPEKRWIKGGVDIEVSINKVTKAGAGLKIYVFNGGGQKETQEISKIKFTVMPFLTEDQVSEIAQWNSIN